MRTRITIEPDSERLLAFLRGQNYEHPWSKETLDDSLKVRLDRDGRLDGYVWATWTEPGVLDFHGCSTRRLWMTPMIVARLFVIAEFVGADVLTTTPVGANAPRIRQFLARAGFRDCGDHFRRELHYGHVQAPEDRPGSGHPASH